MGVTVFLAIMLLHSRSCIMHVWDPVAYAGTYEVTGDDGRHLEITIRESSEVSIYYVDAAGETHQSEQRWWCLKATRILGPVYKPDRHFYRWVAVDVEPYMVTATHLSVMPTDSQVFPPTDAETEGLIYFRPDALKFKGMWLDRVPE
ncbi:MAG: hypothetical protein AAF356_12730 [Planctomycetota bacterium]